MNPDVLLNKVVIQRMISSLTFNTLHLKLSWFNVLMSMYLPRILSHSQFQHVPLYLEWAPGNVFGEPPKQSQDPEGTGAAETKAGTPKQDSIVLEGSKQKKGDAPKPATGKILTHFRIGS